MGKSNTVREEFLSFLKCSYGLSGQSLFKTIKEFIDSYCLDTSDCRGQGYDGAGKSQGRTKI